MKEVKDLTREEMDRIWKDRNLTYSQAIDRIWARHLETLEAHRGIEVDWSESPVWASHVQLHWSAENNPRSNVFMTIPRPITKTPEQIRREAIIKQLKKLDGADVAKLIAELEKGEGV